MKYLQTLQWLPNNSWFSYLTLILLQLKVVWRMWEYKDLTTGDTSSYFLDAYTWFNDGLINIIWSPLYTAFYGTLLHFSTDAYVVTILHRLIIIFVSTIMVLALMRQLLPNELAWLISAWWAVLPINFNTLYEVHLFTLIPVLAACILTLYKPNPWTRGGAIGILFGSSFLVRNELALATGILGIICIGWEVWQFKNAQDRKFGGSYIYLISYGIPVLLAGLIITFFYTHSTIQFPELPASARPKHTLNICQVYAFGYQQRHPEWTKSPWTECYGLMEQQFGEQLPSLLEAMWANPGAMLEHFLWNIGLTLNGIQVSLFNATSGTVNPDYAPVNLNSHWVIIPTMIIGIILITGLSLLYRERQYWWQHWIKERVLGWLVLLSVAAVAIFIVIPTQRPRPSYLFSLTVLLMASVGMSIFVIARRWSLLRRLSVLMFAVMLLVLTATPNYYVKSERRLLDFYRRFTPFQDIMAKSDTLFLTREYNFELCAYLRRSEKCESLTYTNDDFFSEMSVNMPIEVLLDGLNVNLFYVDQNLLSKFEVDPRAQTFLTSPNSVGWQLIAMENRVNSRWMLFQKTKKI